LIASSVVKTLSFSLEDIEPPFFVLFLPTFTQFDQFLCKLYTKKKFMEILFDKYPILND